MHHIWAMSREGQVSMGSRTDPPWAAAAARGLSIVVPLYNEAQNLPHLHERLAALAARLREILARKRMENVRFDIVPTDDLPVNPRTRKFQLILDRRSPQLTTLAAQTLSYR